MRKRRLPIGWSKRDPRHYRFPLPNVVWEYKLKPIEFVILSYLCCQHSRGGANLSPEMIAKGIHMTVGTVKKYLSSLVSRGLITNGRSLAPTFQRTDDRKFFTLPNEIFLLNLPPSAFMVYAYLLLIEDRRTHTCHAALRLWESTMSGYRSYAEQNIIPRLGGKKMTSITTTDIQRMYTKLKKEGRLREHPEYGHQLSASTVRRIHTMLHRAMADAVRAHIIPRNPADGVTLPKADHTAKRVLTDKKLDDFMGTIKADPFWYDFFYTELTTGLRRGEICGLMWSDLDERNGTLKVSRTLHREKDGRLVAGDTKTYAGTRKIVLPPSTSELLRARKKKSFSPWIFHDPLWPEAPVNPSSAYNQLKRLLVKAGLPSIRFHDLRHTFSTHALASGVDAKTLSGILGHTKASFTLDTYTHTTGDMQKRAADIVGGFLTDYLGEEMAPWQNAENAAMAE